MLRNALFLALRYLRSAPGRTAVLIAGTTVALFLPIFTWRAAALLERTLLLRAERSPILIGAKGNEFDLTLSSLYFRGQVREPIGARELDRVRRAGYGLCVPLYVAHSAARAPIVGTGIEYFEARGLEPSSGRLPALLGEVVAGAEVASRMRLTVGDAVRSDLQNLYNIAGGYPLLLDVVGILAPSGGPDDEAFFVDVKTAWALDGLFHGHSEVTREQAIDPQAAADENVEATTRALPVPGDRRHQPRQLPHARRSRRSTAHLDPGAAARPQGARPAARATTRSSSRCRRYNPSTSCAPCSASCCGRARG